MNNSNDIKPIENVSIRNVHANMAYLYLKNLSKEEREKRFIKKYEEQNIHFSMYYIFKPNIIQFIEEQKVKILGNK